MIVSRFPLARIRLDAHSYAITKFATGRWPSIGRHVMQKPQSQKQYALPPMFARFRPTLAIISGKQDGGRVA